MAGEWMADESGKGSLFVALHPDGKGHIVAEIIKRREQHYDLIDYSMGGARVVETGLLDVPMAQRMYAEVLSGDL
jgi:hypothetical protein